MQNLMNDLTKLFQKDERIFANGKLLKNKLTELALKLDQSLIELLLSDNKAKEHFFIEKTAKKEKVLVFDKDKFIAFVNNKEFLPDSFTRFKNKIGLMINGDYLKQKDDVVLAWAYKDCVLEGGQDKEDQKRDEVFYNETLSPDEIDRLFEPKVLTNFKKYDGKGEHKITEFNADDNLIIKGNNLLALQCLKQKFKGQVKLIYIDPPYNTEGESNTFIYNNKFNHSSWLTFMKNRLEVAKDFLSEEGVIVITIDDFEQAHLKVMCDEIFKRENFIGTVVVQSNPRGRTTNTHFATSHEYALFYAKDIEQVSINFTKLTKEQELDFDKKDTVGEYRLLPFRRSGGTSTPEERPNSYYPIYFDEKNNTFSLEKKVGSIEIYPIDKLGKKRVWRQTRPSFLEAVARGDMICKKTSEKWVVYMKDRIKEGRKVKTIWADSKYDASANGTMLLKGIFSGEKLFSYPKSLYTVKDTIDIVTERGGSDIVLDFFAGSGTTAHAVLDLNKEDGGSRQFVLCEQMYYVDTVTKERVAKVIKNIGKGSFIYVELKKWNEECMIEIQEADSSRKLLNIYEKMKKESFFRYDVDLSKFEEKEFEKLSLKEQKQILCECLDKNHLYVNLSEIDDATYKVSADDKKLNKEFYKTVV